MSFLLYILIGMKFIIGESFWPGKSSFLWREKANRKKYETTRANISTVMDEGVDIHCKAFTIQVFTVLIVELGTDISKSKGYFEAYPTIR